MSTSFKQRITLSLSKPFLLAEAMIAKQNINFTVIYTTRLL